MIFPPGASWWLPSGWGDLQISCALHATTAWGTCTITASKNTCTTIGAGHGAMACWRSLFLSSKKMMFGCFGVLHAWIWLVGCLKAMPTVSPSKREIWQCDSSWHMKIEGIRFQYVVASCLCGRGNLDGWQVIEPKHGRTLKSWDKRLQDRDQCQTLVGDTVIQCIWTAWVRYQVRLVHEVISVTCLLSTFLNFSKLTQPALFVRRCLTYQGQVGSTFVLPWTWGDGGWP